MDIVRSVHAIPIRLNDERWAHITEEHNELAGLRLEVLETLTSPNRVIAGNAGEHMAVREYTPGKYLVVVYREEETDGFVITAFLTRRANALNRRQQLWP